MPKFSLFKKGVAGLGFALAVSIVLALPVAAAVVTLTFTYPANDNEVFNTNRININGTFVGKVGNVFWRLNNGNWSDKQKCTVKDDVKDKSGRWYDCGVEKGAAGVGDLVNGSNRIEVGIDKAGPADATRYVTKGTSDVRPFVVNVWTTSASGTYFAGQTIPIYVQFNEAVRYIHPTTPQIILETGTVDGVAVLYTVGNYGNGTDTLRFDYTIGGGQQATRLDYHGTDALELPDEGDFIEDADEGQQDADLTLPAPGAAGSLGGGEKSVIQVLIAGRRTPAPPSVTLSLPSGGETLAAGDNYQIVWSTSGEGIASSRLVISTDGGATYPTAIASDLVSSIYSWVVPVVATTQARVKVEALLGDGTVAVSAESGNFTITAPEGSPTSLEPQGEEEGTPGGATQPPAPTSISEDLGLTAATGTVNCAAGDLMKSADVTTVYYCGTDGNRYVFPNSEIYLSWYPSFSGVKTVGEGYLAAIPLGGNVTYKPGSLIKVVLDPKVYVVTAGGVRHWITSEALAAELFGAGWAGLVHDLPEAFLPDYPIGSDINVAADYVL